MGIVGFQKWLLSTFPEVCKVQCSRFGEVYDHVAFDMNQILHQVARKSTSRQALAAAIFRELDQILKNCVPRKSIFFAFDGPGPLAKLLTQRKRRNKSKKEYANVCDSKSSNSRSSKYAVQAIDGLELTPGVDTLYFIRDAVEYWSHSRLQNDRKYRHVDVRISGSDVPGEGELKLIDFCRAGRLPALDSVIIVGGDADIVLQGLATTPIRNFFVYLRKFGKEGGKRTNYVISVWELARTFERLFPQESYSVRIDFILFSILNGNDYVPKVRGVSLPRLWRRYLALKTETRKVQEPPFRGQSVVNSKKRTFNWPFFYALVNSVGVPVPNIMEELRKDQNKDTRPVQDTSEDGKEILKVEDRGKEKLSTSSSDSDVEEVLVYTGNEDGIPMQDFEEYDGMEDVDNDSSGDDASEAEDFSDDEIVDEEEAHIENLVALSGNSSKCYDTERWFRTLLWTLHMYIDGYCCDYTFQYGKPYGPSCEVICRYISDHNGDPFLLHAPVSNAAPLLPHQAAMAMLPRHASHLLPGPLRLLLEDPVVAKRMFPSNDVVRLPEMLRSIEKIPPTAYASEERKRTVHARPFLLRRPREHDFIPKVNPSIGKPGPKFPNLPQYPTILRKFIIATQAPPCYPWPAGSIQNMLQLPYKVVGGTPLKRPPRKDRTIMGKRLGPNISRAVTGPSRSKQSPLTDGRIGKKVQTQQDAPLKNSVS